MMLLKMERFLADTYNILKSRKYRPFKVLKRINNNAYIIDLPASIGISRMFNIITYLYETDKDDEPLYPVTTQDQVVLKWKEIMWDNTKKKFKTNMERKEIR